MRYEKKLIYGVGINDWDIPYKRGDIINKFNSEIEMKHQEIADIEKKKAVFEHLFGKYFDKFIAETKEF